MKLLEPISQQGMIKSRLLHAGFLENAARFPQHNALNIGDQWWTYSEIDEKARRWAQALLEALGRPPRRVGVFAYRGETSYVGVMAALLSGGAFVPLNRTFPIKRTRSMIELAGLDAIIVDPASLPQLRQALEGLRELPLILSPEVSGQSEAFAGLTEARILGPDDLDRAVPLESPRAVDPDSAAYVLFTSGSNGRPKGVPIAHANVGHFLSHNQKKYKVAPQDRLSQTFDQTFDLSIFDIFMAWNAGACVCVLSQAELMSPSAFIQEKEITIWFSVPSVAALQINNDYLLADSLLGLRLSLFCGEALPQRIAEAWQAAAPNSVLENLYGPTELTVACAAYRWDSERSSAECVNGIVPIGKVYEGLEPAILDDNSEEVADGEIGELYVAGPQVFSGYLNDLDRTKASVTARRGSLNEERRFYKTGDLVRRLESGDMVFLGRNDSQLKISGYRIELGEIEAVLRRDPRVVEAVALPWPLRHDRDPQAIIAFVCGRTAEISVLWAALREHLPAYMLPRAIHRLEAFPLNVNGKIDRNALTARMERGEFL